MDGAGFAALPGGHLEKGEDVKECLKREIVEELGIEPEIGRLLYINIFADGDNQPMEFFFEVTNVGDYLDTKALTGTHSHELSEITWVSPAEDFRAGNVLSSEVRYVKGWV